MKTQTATLGTLLAAAALLFGSGCASSRDGQSTGEYIDSRALNAKVKTALLSDDQVKGTDIDVDVWKSVVQLNGFVDSEEQRERAEQIAWSVAGVRGVDNNLALKTDVPTDVGSAPARAQSGSGEITFRPEDPAVTYVQVLANPSYYYGKSVQLDATVDTIIAHDAFTISDPDNRDKRLLIMAHPDQVRQLTPGQPVTIRGTFQEFEKERMQQRLKAPLPADKFDDFNGEPVILADELSSGAQGAQEGAQPPNAPREQPAPRQPQPQPEPQPENRELRD